MIDRLATLSRDARTVGEASALLWSFRRADELLALLTALKAKRGDGTPFAHKSVDAALREIELAQLLLKMPRIPGYVRVDDDARKLLHRAALERYSSDRLRAAMRSADMPDWLTPYLRWGTDGHERIAGQLRFELLTTDTLDGVLKCHAQLEREGIDFDAALAAAVLADVDASLLARMAPTVRWYVVEWARVRAVLSLDAAYLPINLLAIELLRRAPDEVPPAARAGLAELCLWRDDRQCFELALTGLRGAWVAALRAAWLVRDGKWEEAIAAYEAAFASAQAQHVSQGGKPKRSAIAVGRDGLPAQLVWPYLIALLARGDAASLKQVRRYAIAKSGRRSPGIFEPWGIWVHVVRLRTGEAAVDMRELAIEPSAEDSLHLAHLWRLLGVVWLGGVARAAYPDPTKFDRAIETLAVAVARRAGACEFTWLASLADAAAATVRGTEPPCPFFVSGVSDRWRDVLSMLEALEQSDATAADAVPSRRILWAIDLTPEGAVRMVTPMEQKRGVRGWGKATEMSLAKVAADKQLVEKDALVARSLRIHRFISRQFEMNRAMAIEALVGHPFVVFVDRPEEFVELSFDTPELESIEEDGQLSLRMYPPLHAADTLADPREYGAGVPADAEALRLVTVIRDSPTRARVVRYNATQLRAYTLLATKVVFPDEGRPALQRTLGTLAKHFRVLADAGEGTQVLPAEARLRAELSPVGDGLRVRLVAAPLGVDGPRLEPGQGRVRLLAHIGGAAVATERLLASEREHLAAILDALPYLEAHCSSPAPCEWLIDDAELALEAVETLPRLDAHVGVDWPKGQPVRVQRLDVPQLQISIRSERDWFRVEAALPVDETHVLAFEQLLAAASGRSRFVAMGDGVYAALSRALKQRLADLASVVEQDRHGNRVAAVGAVWLRDLLDGAAVQADAGFRAALDALQRAQETEHAVPHTLQAQLRPYQEDGFRWAMCLAEAGLGGCLADDMGLGKTLQALAVLCARAPAGPALVVAPTSVCGNWIAEALRFAPTLRVVDYASAAREVVLLAPAPMDVVVVSYALLLQDKERFAAHVWHTLIVDEAQAIKNPVAKRSVALFEMDAHFRLALSGTPVENRLAELWSILRFSTPGLLGSLTRFGERFVGPIERERDRDALAVLRRLVAPFVLRRTKVQVLHELPERTETVITVVPEANELAHYEALRRDAMASVDQALADTTRAGQARFNILAQLMRLRRAACDPRLVSPALSLAGEKIQVFLRLVADLVANGHRALVFSQFVDFLNLLRGALDAEGVRYQTLDGSTPAAERTRRVNAFQAGDGDLFLISLKAGGVGLNLTAADYVVITDPWWNPAVEDQATGRAHRIGQQRPVTVYRLVTAGTIEERIVELHRDKRDIAEGILETGDVAALPSTEQLIALIQGAKS